ncbi:hypothetical protein [Cellulomonas hominis]|uniref:hypothetical protein n=1 Tax=Cellulomonas hominis TaxID=156981 RepID=UPI0014438DCC|nr:hypothetical protein [Cellulomonas hominis]NKY08953.1 hypothetical protein [Cellulomonas hominis]
MDGQTVISVASAGIAALSAGLALWVRWRDRAQADWVAIAQAESRQHGYRQVFFTLRNCGDGVAYRLVLTGEHCDARFLITGPQPDRSNVAVPRGLVAQLPPGGEVEVTARMLVADADRLGAEAALVTLRWLHTPTRHRRTQCVRVDMQTLEVGVDGSGGSFLVLHEPWWARITPARRRARWRARQWHRTDTG